MGCRLLFLRLAIISGVMLALCACQTAEPRGAAQIQTGKWVGNYIDGQGHAGLQGLIILKETGTPVAGAFVNVYPDTISNLLGPSQFISSPTDAGSTPRFSRRSIYPFFPKDWIKAPDLASTA